MRFQGPSRLLPFGIAAVLLLLLAALATLQARWVNELSRQERVRVQAVLLAAASGFTEDFDRELGRAFADFSLSPLRGSGLRPAAPPPADEAARQYERWRAGTRYPRLLRGLYYLRTDGQGGLDLQVLQPAARRFEPCPWPPELAAVRRDLLAGTGEEMLEKFGSLIELQADPPGLLSRKLLVPRREPGGRPATEALFASFDQRAITSEILPDLARRHFRSAQGLDPVLAVVERHHPQKVIFLSDPRVSVESFHSAELRLDLFGLRSFQGPRPGLAPNVIETPADAPWRGDWQLLVRPRNATLDEAVAAFRRRNLGISAAILALLAVTTVLMMVTAQRAQRLARQQVELVAGVTHELNTPLTAMRWAGQNLAEDVVIDPVQVRRYGALIEKEGQRLSNMVAQALELAGIQSGRRIYHPQPAEVGEILDGVLDDCRWLLQERGIAVDKDVPPGLPPALADAAALRRAVQNLVENAAKHGGRGGWIGLRACSEPPDGIGITVEDRGPGIPREDLAHLFEPFYRGRNATARCVPGSGLGLSLVRHIAEAHGGRVSVGPGAAGQGTAFTLHLPAADLS